MPEERRGSVQRALKVVVAGAVTAMCLLPAPRAEATFCPGPGYNASQVLNATYGVVLEWSACGGGIDVQLSAATTGWIRIGWGAVPFGGGEVIRAHVVSGVPTVEDTHFVSFFGWGHSPSYLDLQQDLSDTGASEAGGVTTFRFSRLLDTGDALEDVALPLGPATLVWQVSFVTDDFSEVFQETGEGYGAEVTIDLSRGVAHRDVPAPAALALLGIGLAGLASAALGRRRRS